MGVTGDAAACEWEGNGGDGGFEPPIRVLQFAPKRPSTSSSVHFIREIEADEPRLCAIIRSCPPVLLSVLLSK